MSKRLSGTVVLSSVVGILISPLAAHAISLGQIDDFQDGTVMNWFESVNFMNPNPSPNEPTNEDGGPGGAGDLFLQNISSGGVDTPGSKQVMSNESQWRGDYLTAGVNAIEMNLTNLGQSQLDIRVALASGTPPALSWYSSVNSFPLEPGSGWHSATFGLSDSDLTRVQGTATLEETLGSVFLIRILSASSGPNFRGDTIEAILGVDDIHAIPEPSTWLLALGGLPLVWRRPRRSWKE